MKKEKEWKWLNSRRAQLTWILETHGIIELIRSILLKKHAVQTIMSTMRVRSIELTENEKGVKSKIFRKQLNQQNHYGFRKLIAWTELRRFNTIKIFRPSHEKWNIFIFQHCLIYIRSYTGRLRFLFLLFMTYDHTCTVQFRMCTQCFLSNIQTYL